MSLEYLAYGSNLWPPQMLNRCPTARVLGVARVVDWAARYDKPSSDGSAKLTVAPSRGREVFGVLYEIGDADVAALDLAEPGYRKVNVVADLEGRGVDAFTYSWPGEPTTKRPYDWYVAMVVAGARHHHLPAIYVDNHLEVPSTPDPLAPGIRPADAGDLEAMQTILGVRLTETDAYSLHPGELAWWLWHADPRRPPPTCWIQGDQGLLILNEQLDDVSHSGEIDVFATRGASRASLVAWAQRRLGGRGQVAGVADDDEEMVPMLKVEGYAIVASDRCYTWDLLETPVPEPEPPPGYELRPLRGEEEADNRRRASHAAFESTMDHYTHLDRYLRFMRSPVYDLQRDLVAVAPDGRIASFMIWWPDPSGIAQIEPFGTHPEFHRLGLGRALIHYGLRRMRDAGMRVCRVNTDDYREATRFYPSVGFTEVGGVNWWAKTEKAANS